MLAWAEPVWAGMSLHERDEWLRLDGIRRFDPHEDSPDGSRLGVRPRVRDTGVGRVVSGLAPARRCRRDPATRHWRADGRATPEPGRPPTPLRPSTPATPKTGPRRGRSGAAATMSAAGIAVATAPCACRSFRKPKAKAKPKRGKWKAAWKREPSRRPTSAGPVTITRADGTTEVQPAYGKVQWWRVVGLRPQPNGRRKRGWWPRRSVSLAASTPAVTRRAASTSRLLFLARVEHRLPRLSAGAWEREGGAPSPRWWWGLLVLTGAWAAPTDPRDFSRQVPPCARHRQPGSTLALTPSQGGDGVTATLGWRATSSPNPPRVCGDAVTLRFVMVLRGLLGPVTLTLCAWAILRSRDR